MRRKPYAPPAARRRGSSVMDTILTLPMYMALIVLMVMMLNLAIAYQQTTMIARAAVRDAVLEYDPRAGNLSLPRTIARARCDDEAERFGMDPSRMTCDVFEVDAPMPGTGSAAGAQRLLAVRVNYQYHFNALGFASPGSILSVPFSATMYAAADYTGGEQR